MDFSPEVWHLAAEFVAKARELTCDEMWSAGSPPKRDARIAMKMIALGVPDVGGVPIKVVKARLCKEFPNGPDFEFQLSNGTELEFQAVVVNRPGRKYSSERAALKAAQLSAKDGFFRWPITYIPVGLAIDAIKRAAETKAGKGYDPKMALVIYVNLDVDDEAALKLGLVNAVKCASTKFNGAYVLFGQECFLCALGEA